jgi:5-enolpyruvylshikimate-3-phosphate synthase
MIFRLISSQAACGTSVGAASTFGNADTVRLINSGTTVRLVTVANSSDTTLGTVSIAGGERMFIRKNPTDQIFAAHAEILGVGCIIEY